MTSPHAEEKGQLGRSLAVVQNVNTGEVQAVVAGAYQESVGDISKAGRVHRFPIR